MKLQKNFKDENKSVKSDDSVPAVPATEQKEQKPELSDSVN